MKKAAIAILCAVCIVIAIILIVNYGDDGKGDLPDTASYKISFCYTTEYEYSESTVSIPEGSRLTEPKMPVWEGYTLIGWYYQGENGEVKWNFDDPVTSDMMLTAKWDKNFFTVTFNSNGGGAIDSQNVTKGEKITALQVPKYEQHTFEGWYLNGELWHAEEDTVMGDITLVAGWSLGSDGLKYRLSEDGKSYTVMGIGTCTDQNLLIPTEYNGLPVKTIKSRAFYNCGGIKSLSFTEDSLVSIIESEAFGYCVSLESAEISLSVDEIGEGAFVGCSALIEMTLPFIGASFSTSFGGSGARVQFGHIFGRDSYTGAALADSYYDFYIPMSLKSVTVLGGNVPPSAFTHCKYIESISLPESAVSIGDAAFNGCEKLASITVPKSVSSLGSSSFGGCIALKSVTFEDGIVLENIGGSAFSGCVSLESINLTDGIQFLGDSMFAGCTSLRNVSIAPSVKEIGDGAFSGCISLESIALPEGVVSIGISVFKNCTSLTSVTVPNTMTSVGMWVFSGCTNLSYTVYDNAYYLGNEDNRYVLLVSTVSESVLTCEINPDTKVIGCSAFTCPSLTSVVIPDGVVTIGTEAFRYCKFTEITIPSSVKKIGSQAFTSCTMLETVNIYGGGESVYYDTFPYCSALNYSYYGAGKYLGNEDNPYLVLIEVPNLLTSYCEIHPDTEYVGSSALRDCGVLDWVIIPSGVKKIGVQAFLNCASLEAVYIESLDAWLENKLESPLSSNGGVLYVGGVPITDVVVPSGITEIADYAFSGFSNIKSVTFSEGVKSIGEYAFLGCTALETVNFPASLTNISKGAFNGCTSLENLIFADGSKLESVGEYAFSNCVSLEAVVLPAGLKRIETGAFYNAGLYSVSIPDSIEYIGRYAFAGCDGITCMIWNGTMHYLGNAENPFLVLLKADINGDTDVEISDRTKVICDSAFKDWTARETIVIPIGVEYIGYGAFSGCTNLTIYAEGNQKTDARDWDSEWNDSNRPVYWDYEASEQ